VQSGPLAISIEPAPETSFVLNLGTSGSNLIVSPATVVFTAASPAASFTIFPLTPNIGRATSPNYPGVGVSYSSTPTTFAVTGRDATDTTAAYTIPLVNNVGIIVTPGSFIFKHPRYQLDVKSKIHVEISALPRSDVVLTLFANNIQFEPSYVVFVAGGSTKQEITVTPVHTTSYELDYASFKVDYIVSGTNAGDYITPPESLHYIAIPRGYIAAIVIVPFFFLLAVGFGLFKLLQK